MISIRIATAERKFADDLRDLDEGWIAQHIHRRRAEGQQVCVQVTIHVEDVNMGLSTPSCAPGGGGRPPNNREQEIFFLWRKHGLDDNGFDAGNVIAFLKQLKKYL